MKVTGYMNEEPYLILKKLLSQLRINGKGPLPTAGRNRYWRSEFQRENPKQRKGIPLFWNCWGFIGDPGN